MMVPVEFRYLPDGYFFGLHDEDYNSLLCKESDLETGANFYSMDEDAPQPTERIGASAIVFVHELDDEIMESMTRPDGQRWARM